MADEDQATGRDDILLVDRLYDHLSEAIIQGEFAPGSKLSEPRLAARFGVSRGPVREAIRKLEARRLVSRLPRQGVRVLTSSRGEAKNLFKIREVLEGLAAREAARNRTPAETEELKRLLIEHRRTLAPDATLYSQATMNSDFHFLITRMARNDRLSHLLNEEYYALLRFHRMRHGASAGRAQVALHEHEQIAEAIIDGDEDLAEFLMRRHVRRARSVIEQN